MIAFVIIADRVENSVARDRARIHTLGSYARVSMPVSHIDSFPSPLPGENRQIAVVAAMERGLRETVTLVPR